MKGGHKEDPKMSNLSSRPRILIVTPEIVFVPGNKEKRSYCKKPLSAGFDAFPTDLINNLFELGADVHVALPDYRKIFDSLIQDKRSTASSRIPGSRVYLAEDRAFFYSNPIDTNREWENLNIAIAFQREVDHHIVPRVQPGLIHCHDWMTGLVPAMARRWRIPCLFTVQNLCTAKSTLSRIEDRGIDGASIWQQLFYDRYPGNYEETRNTNPVDFLLSGIFAAHYVNTASPVLLPNIDEGQNGFFDALLRQVLAQKWKVGCVCEILSPSDPSCNPASNKKLLCNYGPNAHPAGKQKINCIMKRRTPPFNHRSTPQRYIGLYEKMLQRPLVKPEDVNAHRADKMAAKNSSYAKGSPKFHKPPLAQETNPAQ
jgi:starch synthase